MTAPGDMLQLLVLVDARNVGNRIGVAERPVAVIRIAGKVAGFDSGPLGVDDGYTAQFRPGDSSVCWLRLLAINSYERSLNV